MILRKTTIHDELGRDDADLFAPCYIVDDYREPDLDFHKLPTASRIELALAICDSEQLMWMIAGPNHPEVHLSALRQGYRKYTEAGGGWGRRT